MFGIRKKINQPEAQLPYEVYETMQQPPFRRRQWIIRLGATLVVVTLLIFGAFKLSQLLLNRDTSNPSVSTKSQADTTKGPGNLSQNPQQNTPLADQDSKPEIVPQAADNNSTVRKPE